MKIIIHDDSGIEGNVKEREERRRRSGCKLGEGGRREYINWKIERIEDERSRNGMKSTNYTTSNEEQK